MEFPFSTFFGILPSSILIIWPAHPNLLILISSTMFRSLYNLYVCVYVCIYMMLHAPQTRRLHECVPWDSSCHAHPGRCSHSCALKRRRSAIQMSYRKEIFALPESDSEHIWVKEWRVQPSGYLSESCGNTLICVTQYPGEWVDLGSSRASCSPRGQHNMSGDAPRSVPSCFCPEIWGHFSHLIRIICADTWLGSDWLSDTLTDSLTDMSNSCAGHLLLSPQETNQKRNDSNYVSIVHTATSVVVLKPLK
jgi:hypothetical protein